MSNLPQVNIKTKIDNWITANGIKSITGPQMNEILTDLLESLAHFDEDRKYFGLKEFEYSRTYVDNECCVLDGVVYQNQSGGNLQNLPPLDGSVAPDPWVAITDDGTTTGSNLYEFAPYDNATSYVQPNTVRKGNKLYLCIAPTTGNAPPNLTYWQEVSPSTNQFGTFWAANTYYTNTKVVRFMDMLWQLNSSPGHTSIDFMDDLEAGLWSPLPNVWPCTLTQLQGYIANNQIGPGRIYYITDHWVFLIGLTQFSVGESGWVRAKNCDWQKVGIYESGFGSYEGTWSNGGTYAIGDVVKATDTDGKIRYFRNNSGSNSNPSLLSDWLWVQRGVWDSTQTYFLGDVVIYNGLHYKNLTASAGSAPSGDTTNWVVLATSDESYIEEVDAISFDVAQGVIYKREDRRGNSVEVPSIETLSAMEKFPWGNDKVYGCKVENAVMDGRSVNGSLKRIKVTNKTVLVINPPSNITWEDFDISIGGLVDMTWLNSGAVDMTGIIIRRDYSNLEAEIFIPGSGEVDLLPARYIGVYKFTNTQTITLFTSATPPFPIKLMATAGDLVTVALTAFTPRTTQNTAITLDGDRGDYSILNPAATSPTEDRRSNY